MISKAQIYNITLNILGVSSPLENANSNDSKAVLLNNYYELARDYVLKDFDWNFASTFKEPSLYPNDCNYLNYKYAFNYPNDCICVRDVFQKGNFVQQKFIVSSMQDGTIVILTDIEQPILRYTRRITQKIAEAKPISCEILMGPRKRLSVLRLSIKPRPVPYQIT